MNKRAVIVAASGAAAALAGAKATLIVEDEYAGRIDAEAMKTAARVLTDGPPPPRRLSAQPTHKDYHPSFMRVGVRVDGVEFNTIRWYDADRGVYEVHHDPKIHHGVIEPYWRFEESRQQRRARERWESKR